MADPTWPGVVSCSAIDDAPRLLENAAEAYHRHVSNHQLRLLDASLTPARCRTINAGERTNSKLLFPELWCQLFDHICGETAEGRRGIVCWLDAIDHVKISLWEHLSRLRADEEAKVKGARGLAASAVDLLGPTSTLNRVNNRISVAFEGFEGPRADAAVRLLSLLALPTQENPEDSAEDRARHVEGYKRSVLLLGSAIAKGPAWAKPQVQPVAMRLELLPPCTQRMLTASRWSEPSVKTFDGGLRADPLLPVLLDRYRVAYGQANLQQQGAGAAPDRKELRMAPRDLAILHLIRYRCTHSRKGEFTPAVPSSNTPGVHATSTKEKHLHATAFRPLAYATRLSLQSSRPYLHWLWEAMDACLPPIAAVADLPALDPPAKPHTLQARRQFMLKNKVATMPPPSVPDAELFLSAIVAYWLGQNHPYTVCPLPGQGPSTAVPVPAQEAGRGMKEGAQAQLVTSPTGNSSWGAPRDLATSFGPGAAGRGLEGWRGRRGEGKAEAAAFAAATAGPSTAGNGGAQDPLASATSYTPASVDLCEAVLLMMQSLCCNEAFPAVMAGLEADPCKGYQEGEHPLGREQSSLGGPSILGLAAEALHKYPSLSVQPASSGVRRLVKDMSVSEVWRRYLQETQPGAHAEVLPEQLRAVYQGPLRMPDTLTRIHAPLFHWLRVHLSQADVQRDPLTFAAVVDTWLAVLTPWRARPKYKSLSGKGADGEEAREKPLPSELGLLRAGSRCFDYAGKAGEVLQAEGERARASGEAQPVIRMTLQDMFAKVRCTPEYQRVLQSSGDFRSGVPALLYGKACGERWAQGLSPHMWQPWVRLHYAFYTHLLHIFLSRMRTVAFTGDAWSRSSQNGGPLPPHVPWHEVHTVTEAVDPFGPDNNVPEGAVKGPNGPVLLECLERVLDVFEPAVVDLIRAAENEMQGLFPPFAAQGQATVRGTGAVGSPTGSVGAMAGSQVAALAGQASSTSAQAQLLAHTSMLQLPTDVHPCHVCPSLLTLQEEAMSVTLRLQASMDSGQLGEPAPLLPGGVLPSGSDTQGGGYGVYGGGRAAVPALHHVRIPDVPLPRGAALQLDPTGIMAPLSSPPYWAAMAQGWADLLAFLFYFPLAPLAWLWQVARGGTACHRDWMFAMTGAFFGFIGPVFDQIFTIVGSGPMDAPAKAAVLPVAAPPVQQQGQDAAASPGRAVQGGAAPQGQAATAQAQAKLNTIYRPPVYRLGDRLQLCIDRLALLTASTPTPSLLPPPPSVRIQAQRRSTTQTLQYMLWETVDWWLLRNGTERSHEAKLAASSMLTRTGVAGGAGSLRASMYGSRIAHVAVGGQSPPKTWESLHLIRLTAFLSGLLRTLLLTMLQLIMWVVRAGERAAHDAAAASAHAPASIVLPVYLQGNFLRDSVGLADIRILPFWLTWLVCARVLGWTGASVLYACLYVLLRLSAG